MANTDQRIVNKIILIPPPAAAVPRPPVPRTLAATKKPVASIGTTSKPPTVQENISPPVQVVKPKASLTTTTLQPNAPPLIQVAKPMSTSMLQPNAKPKVISMLTTLQPNAPPPVQVAKPKVPTTLQPNAPPPQPVQVAKPKTISTPTTLQPNAPPPVQVVTPKAKAPDPNEECILDSDTTICEDFMAGRCLKSRLCGHHHIKTPYLWQYQDLKNTSGYQEWVSFSPEVVAKMEEVFSQPSNIICNLQDIETRLKGWTVHFDKMVLEISDSYQSKRVKIRRLSTPSSVESTSGALSTKWVWYFENNNSWCPYGQSVKPGTSASITSDDIERAYVTKQPTYKFLTNEYPYTLDFTGMYQLNMDPRYSTKRNVRRRPTYVPFHSASNTRTNLTASQPSSVARGSLPPTWKPMPQKEAFKRVSLAPTDPEFREVEKLFRQTMGEDMIILQIERVQNLHLWKKYSMNKQLMMQKSLESRYGRDGGRRTHYDERKLFHGTDPDITKGICHQNFDFRLSGKNATVYGKGSYFAKEASYSHRYSKASPDGTRYMFLANVLVGMYTTGKQNIPRPPPIDPSDPYGDLYDSCVDNKDNPSIFVVFKDDQCYPAYLIKYANQHDLAAIDHDMLDPLGGYPFSYSSRQVQGPSTPSRSSNVRAGSSSSTSYSTYGRQGTPTSSPTRQSATTSYPSYGVQSQSPGYPASRYTSSASFQTFSANITSPPPSQQSNSSSGSPQKTSCSIQ
ncbi:TIPARP [Branchiostoma lanceolatum]|uniref:TIPARP protein n=1 Tax=Branchiostoma lanceolatum TaxID=7740 RepID=A0A8J9VXS7_BRALA|nr:TIPARP [Branchiostoma lanceolatum]